MNWPEGVRALALLDALGKPLDDEGAEDDDADDCALDATGDATLDEETPDEGTLEEDTPDDGTLDDTTLAAEPLDADTDDGALDHDDDAGDAGGRALLAALRLLGVGFHVLDRDGSDEPEGTPGCDDADSREDSPGSGQGGGTCSPHGGGMHCGAHPQAPPG